LGPGEASEQLFPRNRKRRKRRKKKKEGRKTERDSPLVRVGKKRDRPIICALHYGKSFSPGQVPLLPEKEKRKGRRGSDSSRFMFIQKKKADTVKKIITT